MKIMISFLSLVVLFFGVVPFLKLPFLPSSGTGYAVVLTVVGILITVAGIMNNMLVGTEKFFAVMQGLLVLLLGIIHWFPTFLAFIPRDGIVHTVLVILVGVLGLAYGLLGMA